MADRAIEGPSRLDRASESAPSLVVAYAAYLLLAAITVSAGGRIPPLLIWISLSAIVWSTSRHVSPSWSLYNAFAAVLFFTSFSSKPFGDVHVGGKAGWLALIALIGIALFASMTSARPHRPTPGGARRGVRTLPWMHPIPPIHVAAGPSPLAGGADGPKTAPVRTERLGSSPGSDAGSVFKKEDERWGT